MTKSDKDVENNQFNGLSKGQYRKYLTIGVVILAIIFGAGVKYARFVDGSDNAGLSAQAIASIIVALPSPSDKAEGQIAVSLNGAVKTQGYYGMPQGTTLKELLDHVGLLDKADISTLDNKKVLANGDRVIIPFAKGTLKDGSTSVANVSDTNINAIGEKININTATAAQLMQLPNIGEKRAAAIIAYRESNGNFTTINAINNVKGIGDTTFKKIKGLICVE